MCCKLGEERTPSEYFWRESSPIKASLSKHISHIYRNMQVILNRPYAWCSVKCVKIKPQKKIVNASMILQLRSFATLSNNIHACIYENFGRILIFFFPKPLHILKYLCSLKQRN